MEANVNDVRKKFDWLAFGVRLIAIIAIATWLLVERLDANDHTGTVLVIIFGYILLPVLAYIHTRYYNSKLTFGIAEIVRRKIGGRGRST